MKIREFMNSPAHACTAQDSLESAARLMWDHDCGALPVLDREGRAGAVITDRDICMATLMTGKRLADLRVADAMSRGLATCLPDDDLAVAVRRMCEHQVRRLPVVDQKGKLCGIVSLNDLAIAGINDAAVARDAAKVLGAVCKRRAGVPATVPAPAPIASAAPKAASQVKI
jgi:CBS-domain-containing membrane protein